MLNNAFPANATTLPVVASLFTPRAEWAVSVGHTAADIAALTFPLPIPRELRPVFEDTIREQVAAELLPVLHIGEDERRQIEDIAWIAFDRRLSRHDAMRQGGAA